MELAHFLDDFRDVYSLHNLSFETKKGGRFGQPDPINMMVPAVAREMHKLGFDHDLKERTDFPTF